MNALLTQDLQTLTVNILYGNPSSAGYCFITIIPPGGSYIMTSNRIMATSGNLTANDFFNTPPNLSNTVYALADRNSRGVEMDMLISTSEEIR